MTNLILASDSYKHSHFLQYPPEARTISAYVEARPNDFSDQLLFFGLQPFLDDYLDHYIEWRDIEEAKEICAAHGIPFNYHGWYDIIEKHDGYLPLEIKALPEGMIVPTGVPLIQVENTDPTMPWLTTFIETALLRAIWYPTTVATLSWKCKQVIKFALEVSSDDVAGQLPFKLHDFGARGVSSGESAALGGMAHLVNFMGSDTLEGIMAARRYYGADMPGFSIPAAEHSTMTSWGRDREVDAYLNMLTSFDGLVAVVSDSYDLDVAVGNIWGDVLKPEVMRRNGVLVVRPDSGDPIATPIRTVQTLWEKFGGTVNSKGFRVLDPHVRVIQGDGMNIDSISELCAQMLNQGFAIDNIAFGMGGGLLQQVNRDTLRFAMKANAMQDDQGIWTDVCKRPATDPSKGSKAGRQAVHLVDGVISSARVEDVPVDDNLLQTVWRNGSKIISHNFEDVRARASK